MSSHTHLAKIDSTECFVDSKAPICKTAKPLKICTPIDPPEKLLLPSEINAVILTFLEVGNQINRSDSSHSNDPEPHW